MSNTNSDKITDQLSADATWAAGKLQSVLGEAMGDEGMRSKGEAKVAKGNADYNAIQSKQHAEGSKHESVDHMKGKVNSHGDEGPTMTHGTGLDATQSTGLGTTQITGLDATQGTGLDATHNTGLGATQSTGLGATQGTGLGATQGTAQSTQSQAEKELRSTYQTRM